MGCVDCPYEKEELERCMNWYQIVIERLGIPNDIYGNMTYDDVLTNEQEYGWCDKVGGKHSVYGYCEYASSCVGSFENRSKKRRRNKRERDLKYKQHIKRLAQSNLGYPQPVKPVAENGTWNFDDPVDTVYYKRLYRGKRKRNRYHFYKRYANRCVRRYKGTIKSGNSYRKIFDYWWSVD